MYRCKSNISPYNEKPQKIRWKQLFMIKMLKRSICIYCEECKISTFLRYFQILFLLLKIRRSFEFAVLCFSNFYWHYLANFCTNLFCKNVPRLIIFTEKFLFSKNIYLFKPKRIPSNCNRISENELEYLLRYYYSTL